jgi:NAD(P)H-quinone oxidoreductase subunit 5
VVDGLVNLVGVVTIFSGQSLKYNVSGQSQFYLLTILLGLSGYNSDALANFNFVER